MAEARTVLWFVLFWSAMVITILNNTINIAITAMVKRKGSKESEGAFCLGKNHTISDSSFPLLQSNVQEETYDWSDTVQNIILSVPFWSSGLTTMLGGLLVHKYGAKMISSVVNVTMVLSAFLTPSLADVHYLLLVCLRIIQGIATGFGIIVPTALISKWISPNSRGKYFTSLLGVSVGFAIAYAVNGYIIFYLGWRYTFYVSGVLAFTVAIFWHFSIFDTPQSHPRITVKELNDIFKNMDAAEEESVKKLVIPWKKIFLSVPFLVNVICQFSTFWTLAFFSAYTPTYLKVIHGLGVKQIGLISGYPFILQFVFSFIFGFLADFCLDKNYISRTNVRKIATFINCVLTGFLTLAFTYVECNTTLAIILITLIIPLNGTVGSGVAANLVDLSPNFCSILFGISGTLGCLPGFLAPNVVGYLTHDNHTTEQWNKVFVITGVIDIVTGLLFLYFGKSDVQVWNYGKHREIIENSDKAVFPTPAPMN